jgi:hypothetical protein
MSTGLPFNATFNYMRKIDSDDDNGATISDIVSGSTSPQRTARERYLMKYSKTFI